MSKKIEIKKIEVNPNWCKRCGICIEFCPKCVLKKGELGSPAVVHFDICTACRLCELYCPEFAITVV